MAYLDNALPMNPKAIDLGGGSYHAMISHTVDERTLHLLLTEKFKKGTDGDLTVTEVTKKSLKTHHLVYADMVESLFLKFGTYPNING